MSTSCSNGGKIRTDLQADRQVERNRHRQSEPPQHQPVIDTVVVGSETGSSDEQSIQSDDPRLGVPSYQAQGWVIDDYDRDPPYYHESPPESPRGSSTAPSTASEGWVRLDPHDRVYNQQRQQQASSRFVPYARSPSRVTELADPADDRIAPAVRASVLRARLARSHQAAQVAVAAAVAAAAATNGDNSSGH